MSNALNRAARRVVREYTGGASDAPPVVGYAVTLGTYATIVGGLAALARRRGARLPDRVPVTDVALGAVATHKISRLLAKDSVTSPLRAPFTRYQQPIGESELGEQVRGEGVRHSVGELISCPFCLAVWVATGLSAGLVFAPRLTRLVAATFAGVAGSDFLQLGYDIAKRHAEQG
ncbi:MAG TPA: DUF1360 domain-containing protein [Micromonosporaceae bacterium]